MAIATLIGLVWLSNYLLGPVVCRDGWASPSIGHRDACSWHGGVSHSRDMFIFLFLGLSAFARWTVFKTLANSAKVQKPSAHSPGQDARAEPLGPRRPRILMFLRHRLARECGRNGHPDLMAQVSADTLSAAVRWFCARRGMRAGPTFHGCSRSRACRGTRPFGR